MAKLVNIGWVYYKGKGGHYLIGFFFKEANLATIQGAYHTTLINIEWLYYKVIVCKYGMAIIIQRHGPILMPPLIRC